jgi:hypothetical protein
LREIVLALALFFDRGFGLGFLLFFVCGQKSLIQLVVLQGGSDVSRSGAGSAFGHLRLPGKPPGPARVSPGVVALGSVVGTVAW